MALSATAKPVRIIAQQLLVQIVRIVSCWAYFRESSVESGGRMKLCPFALPLIAEEALHLVIPVSIEEL